MMTPKFGAFEGYPARFDTEAWEAWEYSGGKWRRWGNPAEVVCNAHLLDERRYRDEFGDVPPLPKEAFQS